MITFYPRDIGIWRKDFTFDYERGITLEASNNKQTGSYKDRAEFIEFLKSRGVRLDDHEFPLKIEKLDEPNYKFKYATHTVTQWSLLGWIKDDLK
jgi:hypothetical protein